VFGHILHVPSMETMHAPFAAYGVQAFMKVEYGK